MRERYFLAVRAFLTAGFPCSWGGVIRRDFSSWAVEISPAACRSRWLTLPSAVDTRQNFECSLKFCGLTVLRYPIQGRGVDLTHPLTPSDPICGTRGGAHVPVFEPLSYCCCASEAATNAPKSQPRSKGP